MAHQLGYCTHGVQLGKPCGRCEKMDPAVRAAVQEAYEVRVTLAQATAMEEQRDDFVTADGMANVRVHIMRGLEDSWTPAHKRTWRYLLMVWEKYWAVRERLRQQNQRFTFLSRVSQELARARVKHPRPLNSHHEAYAVVLEELQEAWEEVRQQQADPMEIIAELLQVAAMCNRWAEDVCGMPRYQPASPEEPEEPASPEEPEEPEE